MLWFGALCLLCLLLSSASRAAILWSIMLCVVWVLCVLARSAEPYGYVAYGAIDALALAVGYRLGRIRPQWWNAPVLWIFWAMIFSHGLYWASYISGFWYVGSVWIGIIYAMILDALFMTQMVLVSIGGVQNGYRNISSIRGTIRGRKDVDFREVLWSMTP